MKKIQIVANKLFIPFCIAFYFLIVGVNYLYKCDPYLWFDEAGQFWISKGLNHDSDPMSQSGSVVDVVINNQDYNLDPGGFGIIMHFWSMVSNGYIWLRTLPYLFYLGVVMSVIYLSYRWTKNKFVALLMGFVPVINDLISRSMFEIRAYSMEVLGVLVAIIVVDKLREKITFRRLLISSMIISVFLTSRYSYWVVAFVTSTYVLYLIVTSNHEKNTKFWMCSIYAIPMSLTLIGIYFLALRWQNPELKALSYLPYISNDPKLLIKSSNLSLLFKLVIIIWLCFIIRQTKLFSKYIGLAYVTIVTNVMFLVLSFLGKHPWDSETTRCISMMTLVLVSSVALLGELINYLMKKRDMKYVILAIMLVLFVYPALEEDYWEKKGRNNSLTDVRLMQYNSNAKIYVDRWESPCIRYQFEYGKLLDKYEYPQNFVFVKMFKHGFVKKGEKKMSRDEYYQTQPNLNDLLEFDILIVPELYRNKSDNSDKWESVNGNGRVWYKKCQYEE